MPRSGGERQRPAGSARRRFAKAHWLLPLGMLAVGGLVGALLTARPAEPRERSVTIRARQYAYEPEVLRVNRGDTVRMRFVSEDVVHGFYLEGHDIDVDIYPLRSAVELRRPSRPDEVEHVEEVVFVAERAGKYRYRCSHTCGYLHPFMLGEMIVAPNRLLHASVGMGLGLLLGSLLMFGLRES